MDKKRQFLGKEPIGKLLLKLSLPATVGMMVGALYNLVDTIYVGNGVGPLAIGAISIVFPIQAIIMAISQTMGMGGASIVSRALGRGEIVLAEKTIGNIVTIVLIFATLIVVCGELFLAPLLRLFGATDSIMPYAMSYMRIVMVGYFFFSFTMSLNNIVRAEGSAKVSMIIMITGAGMNLILDPIFIFGLKMGIAGAALATMISQILSFSILLFFFLSGKTALKIRFKYFSLSLKILREIVAIGASIFVRQAAGSIMIILINNSLKFYGSDIYISIFGIFHRLLMFMFLPLFGLMQGLQPIVGFNYGAGNLKRVRAAVLLTIKVATLFAVAGTLLLGLGSYLLFSMFTSDSNLINIGGSVMRITVLGLPLVGFNIVGTVMFLAMGRALPSLLLSMTRQIFFFIPLALILPLWFKLNGIWVAFPIADVLSFFVILFMVIRELRKLNLKIEHESYRGN